MSWTGDWTDWAGDHPELAEHDRHQGSRAQQLGLTPSGIDATDPEQDVCGHTEVYPTGHCADCGDEVEGFEPSDAQIIAQHGGKEIAA